MKSTMKLIFLGLLLQLMSCKKEGCTYPDATNYDSEAKKDDGSCVYPEPVVDPRDQYLGNYTVVDSAFGSGGTIFAGTTTYLLAVTTNGTVEDTLYLNSLSNSPYNYYAILSGTTFTIPGQATSSPYLLHGSGSFSGSQITYVTYSGPGSNFINEGSGSK